MRRSVCLLALVAGPIVAGIVLAQEQQRFPIAKTIIVNRRDPYGQIQPNIFSLLAEPDMRSDLKMTDEQQHRIDEILNRRQPPRRPSQPLSADEQKEMNKAFSQKADELKGVLSETQRGRLEQLLIQVQGVFVVVRADVAERLRVTDEQKTKLRQMAKAGPRSTPLGELGKMTDEERQRTIDRWVEGRNQMEAEMLGVLDDGQKTEFAKIRGEPFTFPPTQIGANIGKLLSNDRSRL